MEKPFYTLTDYVRWMGALTFEERPFCDTDALVLCDVVYFDIFHETDAQGKTLSELIGRAPIEESEIVKCLGGGAEKHVAFIRAVEASRRFGAVRLRNFDETLDYEKSIQFAAADFGYKNIWNFIAFRGTDDTIAGWKEDFMIAFTQTPAQELALNFAVKNLDAKAVNNYIGGHSKGGNLALYAASLLPEKLRQRVDHVYDLDGPGFCGEVFDLTALDRIRTKTTFIVPEFSVIGRLFEPDFPDTRIVVSNESTMMQHELLSWGITGEGLDIVSENDPRSKNINRIIDEWVENISQEDRKTFVNELFDALKTDGAKTMTDIMKKGVDGFEKILFQAAGSSRVTKRAAASLPEQALFGNTFKEIKQTGFWQRVSKAGLAQSLAMIITGILFIYAPNNILNVVSMMFITGLALLQIWLTIKRLKENHWNFTMVKERLYLSVILSVLSIFLLVKNNAMFIMGSVIFSISAFVLLAYSSMKTADKSLPLYARLLHGAEAILCLIYGISFLIIPQEAVFAYMVSIGFILIIDAILRAIIAVLEALWGRKEELR